MSAREPADVRIRPATADDADAVAGTIRASRRAFLDDYAPMAHPEPEVRAWVRETDGRDNSVLVVGGDPCVADEHETGSRNLWRWRKTYDDFLTG